MWKRLIIRALANKKICDKLQAQGYVKEAAIAEYEVEFEKQGLENMIGRKLTFANLQKLLRKSME